MQQRAIGTNEMRANVNFSVFRIWYCDQQNLTRVENRVSNERNNLIVVLLEVFSSSHINGPPSCILHERIAALY